MVLCFGAKHSELLSARNWGMWLKFCRSVCDMRAHRCTAYLYYNECHDQGRIHWGAIATPSREFLNPVREFSVTFCLLSKAHIEISRFAPKYLCLEPPLELEKCSVIARKSVTSIPMMCR